jgi:hypothetical protein
VGHVVAPLDVVHVHRRGDAGVLVETVWCRHGEEPRLTG